MPLFKCKGKTYYETRDLLPHSRSEQRASVWALLLDSIQLGWISTMNQVKGRRQLEFRLLQTYISRKKSTFVHVQLVHVSSYLICLWIWILWMWYQILPSSWLRRIFFLLLEDSMFLWRVLLKVKATSGGWPPWQRTWQQILWPTKEASGKWIPRKKWLRTSDAMPANSALSGKKSRAAKKIEIHHWDAWRPSLLNHLLLLAVHIRAGKEFFVWLFYFVPAFVCPRGFKTVLSDLALAVYTASVGGGRGDSDLSWSLQALVFWMRSTQGSIETALETKWGWEQLLAY